MGSFESLRPAKSRAQQDARDFVRLRLETSAAVKVRWLRRSFPIFVILLCVFPSVSFAAYFGNASRGAVDPSAATQTSVAASRAIALYTMALSALEDNNRIEALSNLKLSSGLLFEAAGRMRRVQFPREVASHSLVGLLTPEEGRVLGQLAEAYRQRSPQNLQELYSLFALETDALGKTIETIVVSVQMGNPFLDQQIGLRVARYMTLASAVSRAFENYSRR